MDMIRITWKEEEEKLEFVTFKSDGFWDHGRERDKERKLKEREREKES
jgi:hypothetical protein